jgi:PIN domain nuclease of toxin-antitoxin system
VVVARDGRKARAVSDVTSAVTDTNALLFHASRSARLGRRARELFAAAEGREAVVYVPMAVVWEVTLLARRVRVNLHRPARSFFEDLFSNPAFQAHPLDPQQVFDAGDLRLLNDPFDALICAAARDLELPLMTADAEITASKLVTTIW